MKKLTLFCIITIAMLLCNCNVHDSIDFPNTISYTLYSDSNLLTFNILYVDKYGLHYSHDIGLNNSTWEYSEDLIVIEEIVPQIWLPKINAFTIHVDICYKGACRYFQHTGSAKSYQWYE